MSKLPKFLCVGAQKAGTTWLYSVLKHHPEVFVPMVKELHYFIKTSATAEDDWRHKILLSETIRVCNEYIHRERATLRPGFVQYILSIGAEDRFTDAWYERVYSAAPENALCGDITPGYFQMGEEGISRVRALLGDVKIIVILRDPVERLWSEVRMKAFETNQRIDQVYWTDEYTQGPNPNADYQNYLPIWREHYDDAQLGVFNYHALARDPHAFYQAILDFLKVAPDEENPMVDQFAFKGPDATMSDDILGHMTKLMGPQTEYMKDAFGENWKDADARLRFS